MFRSDSLFRNANTSERVPSLKIVSIISYRSHVVILRLVILAAPPQQVPVAAPAATVESGSSVSLTATQTGCLTAD